jgi:(p)ppGpp synthase/HD superfamily hydrolase
MVYNELMRKITQAIRMAAKAHDGQKDRAGKPYILHPISVMLRMDTEDEMVTAVLHDVIEDTYLTIEDIRSAGFSEEVIEALMLLSKESDDVPYMPFIREIKGNALATTVKLGDLAENMRTDRSPIVKESDLVRMAKYQEAVDYLTS